MCVCVWTWERWARWRPSFLLVGLGAAREEGEEGRVMRYSQGFVSISKDYDDDE